MGSLVPGIPDQDGILSYPPKFPTERQTEQLFELAERIASRLKLEKEPSQRVSADFS
jgi:hypothetical protein